MTRGAIGYVHQAYFVAVTIEGNFTDEELAVACAQQKGRNVESYRKRGHELRREPCLLLFDCERDCKVTGSEASAYTAVPLNDYRLKDKRYWTDAYQFLINHGGEFTDEELAMEFFKKQGGNKQSFRKQYHKLRNWPPLLVQTDRRPCLMTKKPASVYKALPSADVEKLRKMSDEDQKIWKRQVHAAVLRRMNDRLDDQNRQLLADT